jgi:hypothetical protein
VFADIDPVTRKGYGSGTRDFHGADAGIGEGGIGYHYPPIHLLSLYRERGFKEGMFTAMSKAVLRS